MSIAFFACGSAAKPSIELVTPLLHQKAMSLLGDRAVAFENRQILSLGFERDTVDSTQKRLVIFILDSNNQQQKIAVETGPDFYRALYGKPDTLAEVVVGTTSLHEERKAPPASLKQDGRVYFMLNTTLKSLYVYPVNMMRAFSDINGQVVAGLSLLTLGGSLYGSYLFTKNRELGYGRVEFMNYGGDLGGLYYPNLLGYFLDNLSAANTAQVSAWLGMIGYPVGIYMGSRVQFAKNDEYGNASIMTTMSKWGFLYGFLLPLYLDLRDHDYVAVATGLTMGLIPTGFYVGKKLVGDRSYSSGRSILIMTSGIMGAATGALIPTLWESNEPKIYATTALIGQVLGTYFGFNYLAERSYSFGQGLFMSASAIVGGALAEAPLLIARVNGNSHEAYTILGIGGAWGGLMIGEYLSRSLFEKTPHDKQASSAVSFPGVWELPLLFLSKKYGSHEAPVSLDRREPLAQARVMEVSF